MDEAKLRKYCTKQATVQLQTGHRPFRSVPKQIWRDFLLAQSSPVNAKNRRKIKELVKGIKELAEDKKRSKL